MPKIQNTLNLDSNDVENIGTLTATSVIVTGPITSSNQASSKGYVDSVAVGLKPKDEVLCATDGILGGTPTYNPTGGVAGTGSISFVVGPSSVDGISINNGDRILVKDEGLSGGLGAAANGVYTRVSSSTWNRASDFDTVVEVKSGSYFFVEQGSSNQKRGYVLTTADPIDVPSGSKSFAIFLESSIPVSGDGVDIVGSTISLDLKANGGLIFDTGEVAVDLSAASLSGTLTAGFGGTGQSSYVAGDILYSPASNVLTKLSVGSLRQVLSVQASGTPHWRTLENQDSVLDDSVSVPPGSPSAGDRYIVASGVSGDWLGQDDSIAEWDGASWVFTVPVDGTRSYNKASDQIVIYDGSAWGAVSTSVTAAAVSVAATPVNYTAATPDVEAHLVGVDAALGAFSPTVTLQDAYDDTTPVVFPLGGNVRYLDITSDPLAITANQNTPIPQFFAHTTTGGWDTTPMASLNLGTTSIVHAVNNVGTTKFGMFVQQSDGGLTTNSLLPVWNLSGFAGNGLNVSSLQSTTPPIMGGAVIQSYNGIGGTVEYTQNLTYTSLTGGVPAVGDVVTGSSSLATGTVRAFRENVAGTSGEIVIGSITGLFTITDTLSDGVWTASGISFTVGFTSLPSLILAFNQGTVNGRTDIDTGLLSANNHTGGTTNIPVLYVGGSGTQNDSLAIFRQQNAGGGTTGPMVLFDQQNTSHADPTIQITNVGDTVDIQLTARTADPTNLVDGGLWYNSSDAALRYSEGTGSFRAISAWEGATIGPLTVDIHSAVNPLVFEASPQSVPVGSTLFYNDTANTNSIPLGILNNAAAGFGMIAENMTGASLTALAQFQNAGTVNGAGAIFVVQSSAGSTNNGQAFLVVQNQDTAGNNDVPLIRLNHLAGSGTGDAVDIQLTERTVDPTNLVDGGFWFNTTDNQMKFSDGTNVYPLVHLEDGITTGSLNLPVLTTDPSAPVVGDVWLQSNSSPLLLKIADGTNTFPLARKATGTIVGDAVTTNFVITHNLGTRDVSVTVYESVSPWAEVGVTIERTSVDTVTVKFAVAPIVSEDYSVVVVG